MKGRKAHKLSAAMRFILLFGVISLFSDMTRKNAPSIHGVLLSLLGTSAAMIGFASGPGALAGFSLRCVFGCLTDKTKLCWP